MMSSPMFDLEIQKGNEKCPVATTEWWMGECPAPWRNSYPEPSDLTCPESFKPSSCWEPIPILYKQRPCCCWRKQHIFETWNCKNSKNTRIICLHHLPFTAVHRSRSAGDWCNTLNTQGSTTLHRQRKIKPRLRRHWAEENCKQHQKPSLI